MGLMDRMFGGGGYQPAESFTGLRNQALNLRAEDLLPEGGQKPVIHGVLMEMGFRDAAATLVCMADGTTSLYMTSGSAVLGSGEHESVRSACLELIAWINEYAGDFTQVAKRVEKFPLPKKDAVFFYLLTSGGVHLAKCLEAKLQAREDPFSNLWAFGQLVLTKVREKAQEVEDEEPE